MSKSKWSTSFDSHSENGVLKIKRDVAVVKEIEGSSSSTALLSAYADLYEQVADLHEQLVELNNLANVCRKVIRRHPTLAVCRICRDMIYDALASLRQ